MYCLYCTTLNCECVTLLKEVTFKCHQSLEASQKRRGSDMMEEVVPKETPSLPPPSSLHPPPAPPSPPPPRRPPPLETFRGEPSSRTWRWRRGRRSRQGRAAPAGGCPSRTWRGWAWRRGRGGRAAWRSSRIPPPPHYCHPCYPPTVFGIQVFWIPPSQLYIWYFWSISRIQRVYRPSVEMENWWSFHLARDSSPAQPGCEIWPQDGGRSHLIWSSRWTKKEKTIEAIQ